EPVMTDGDVDDQVTPDAPFSFWVEGRVTVQPWDAVAIAHADTLSAAADHLGLHPFRAPEDAADGTPRHRWTHRRVNRDDVLALIERRPGLAFATILTE